VFNPNIDCFGRDKHSDYRDDMGGVGSFMRQNRTLYIGRIHVTDDIEEIVARHFQEWGEIERIRVLTARGVAFVTYVNEANSQFAKEAMAHQALDNNEVLNVRWATVDPNPLSAKREAARIEEQAAEAVRRALPAAFVAELEGRETAEMREERMRESRFGLEGYDAPDEVWFAKAKELEGLRNGDGNGMKNVEGVEEKGLIEDAPVSARDTEQNQTVKESSNGSGILSGATLAALKGYSTNGRPNAPSAVKRAPAGPLVSYGSDDDSD
jgi:RNA recognition motif-containing protein